MIGLGEKTIAQRRQSRQQSQEGWVGRRREREGRLDDEGCSSFEFLDMLLPQRSPAGRPLNPRAASPLTTTAQRFPGKSIELCTSTTAAMDLGDN